MCRDTLDIFHQRSGILEDRVVDALKNVVDRLARKAASHLVGVIDVPGAVARGADEVAADGELAHERGEVRCRLFVCLFVAHDYFGCRPARSFTSCTMARQCRARKGGLCMLSRM